MSPVRDQLKEGELIAAFRADVKVGKSFSKRAKRFKQADQAREKLASAVSSSGIKGRVKR